MARAQNRGPMLPLSDTCCAAVVTRNIPFHVVSARWSVLSCTHLLNGTPTRIPSTPFFDAVFSRHTLCVSLVCVYATLFDAVSSRHSVFHCLCVCTLFVRLCLVRMVQRIKEIVARYEEHLRKMPSVPRHSCGRGLLRNTYHL
jgi:hypothetical protein